MCSLGVLRTQSCATDASNSLVLFVELPGSAAPLSRRSIGDQFIGTPLRLGPNQLEILFLLLFRLTIFPFFFLHCSQQDGRLRYVPFFCRTTFVFNSHPCSRRKVKNAPHLTVGPVSRQTRARTRHGVERPSIAGLSCKPPSYDCIARNAAQFAPSRTSVVAPEQVSIGRRMAVALSSPY